MGKIILWTCDRNALCYSPGTLQAARVAEIEVLIALGKSALPPQIVKSLARVSKSSYPSAIVVEITLHGPRLQRSSQTRSKKPLKTSAPWRIYRRIRLSLQATLPNAFDRRFPDWRDRFRKYVTNAK